MVKGLERFKKHFAPYSKSYVLIGGTACMLVMEEVGLQFRATKDLDIVLYIEALDRTFVEAFGEFIHLGRYQNQQKSTGKKQFYRFQSPHDSTFPDTLELFARKPDGIELFRHSHLTPIPLNEEIASLSAILLDDECYQFIHQEKRQIEGLPVVSSERLIPLKARAWADLSDRLEAGSPVKKDDIRKHKNDVLRLSQLLARNTRVFLPKAIKQSMQQLLWEIAKNPVDPKAIGVNRTKLNDLMTSLGQVYGLSLYR